ncbi:hypothetical protein N7462_005462 [Penicillium macrosclerotiorum]|uniref:uncharacterized protein n=1 Tax=Penicillium macrosclerotiorum TaxID=303699 RepID=UPI002547AA04|nr:uncharacterized protein N7462_005462 [Penicillium macrosclerotiorum]KAJ5682297.1 hypothetical protein N7462_005462 [Penicillium macrosclerotiorum]
MATDDPSPFQSIPWVSKLLQDDSFVTISIASRQVKTTSEDSLFSTTIKSDNTLAACLTQYRRPPQPPSDSVQSAPSPKGAEGFRMFFILGSDMNGYPGILHGGMVATLLDECTGLLLSIRGDVGDASQRNADSDPGPVTAYLNTKFLRPVRTPGVIVVEAQLKEAKEDRKWKIDGEIRDSQDQILATAESLYVRIRSKI